MGTMISPEKLRCYPLFAGLGHDLVKDVAMAGEEIAVKSGEWLFHEGDEADALYVILCGEVTLKVALSENDAYSAALDTLGEGDIIGWSSLVAPYTYTLSAVANRDAKLARLDGVQLSQIMARDSRTGYLLMSRVTQIVACRLAAVHVRFASLIEGGRWQRVDTPLSEN